MTDADSIWESKLSSIEGSTKGVRTTADATVQAGRQRALHRRAARSERRRTSGRFSCPAREQQWRSPPGAAPDGLARGAPAEREAPPEAGGGCADQRGGSATSGRLRVSAHRRRERLSRLITSRARPAAVPSDSRAPGRCSRGTGVSIRRDVLVVARSLIATLPLCWPIHPNVGE